MVKNSQLLGLDVLMVMQEKRLKDPWDTHAREKLEELVAQPDALDNIVYNYARLLENRGLHGQAAVYWRTLIERTDNLPAVYRQLICKAVPENAACKASPAGFSAREDNWRIDIAPGDDIDLTANRRKLEAWGEPMKDALNGIDAVIYRHPNGKSLLAIDRIVELVSIKHHGFDFKDHLLSTAGPPRVTFPLRSDEIWSYGPTWSAVIHGSAVKEIWIAR